MSRRPRRRCWIVASPISGSSIEGSPVERLVQRLYEELDARGLGFHPPVYLSDEWGCPEATPLIGVPFYLADPELARMEARSARRASRTRPSRCGTCDTRPATPTTTRTGLRPRGLATHVRAVLASLPRPLPRRSVLARVRAPRARLVRAEASGRGFRGDLRGVADAGSRLARASTPAGARSASSSTWTRSCRRSRARSRRTYRSCATSTCRSTSMRYTLAEHYQGIASRIPIEDERLFDGDLRTIFGRARRGFRRTGSRRGDFIRATSASWSAASATGRARGRRWCGRSSSSWRSGRTRSTSW